MARLIFDNLTKEQAETLASWFEGQGKQDCGIWFEASECDSPLVDLWQPMLWDGDDYIVQCK